MDRILIGGSVWCWDIRAELPEQKMRDDRLVYDRPASRIRHLWVHHSGTRYDQGHLRNTQLAYIQRVAETAAFGWPYTFSIFANGRRFYTGDVDTGRAHTGDFNDDLAVVFVGHYGRDSDGNLVQKPAKRMLLSGRALLAAIPAIWGHLPGYWPIHGHRESWILYGSQHGRTQCPGDAIMDRIEWLRGE